MAEVCGETPPQDASVNTACRDGHRVFEDRAQMRLRELDFHAIGQSHIDAT